MARVTGTTKLLLGLLAGVGAVAGWHSLPSPQPNLEFSAVDGDEEENGSATIQVEWAFEAPEQQAYAALLKQPVFHPDRVFIEPAQKSDEIAQGEKTKKPPPIEGKALLARMILVGTIVVGDTQKAILRKTPQAESEILAVGDTVAGWKIASIGKGGVQFALDNDRYDLLFTDSGKRKR